METTILTTDEMPWRLDVPWLEHDRKQGGIEAVARRASAGQRCDTILGGCRAHALGSSKSPSQGIHFSPWPVALHARRPTTFLHVCVRSVLTSGGPSHYIVRRPLNSRAAILCNLMCAWVVSSRSVCIAARKRSAQGGDDECLTKTWKLPAGGEGLQSLPPYLISEGLH